MGQFLQAFHIGVLVLLSMPNALLPVLLLVSGAAASRRLWAQWLVAILLFAGSTFMSIWILQLGWGLAAVGILLALSGVVWRLLDKAFSKRPDSNPARVHPSGGLLWPGLALLAAPFANVFVLMPLLRPFFS